MYGRKRAGLAALLSVCVAGSWAERAEARILFIGDSLSMTDGEGEGAGLGGTLHERLGQAGAHVDSFGSCGSTPQDWVMPPTAQDCGRYAQQGMDPPPKLKSERPQRTPLLRNLLAGIGAPNDPSDATDPVDAIIIELGTNFIPSMPVEPAAAAAHIEHEIRPLLQTIGNRVCVWIGTPPFQRPTDLPRVTQAKTTAMDSAFPEALRRLAEEPGTPRCTYVSSFNDVTWQITSEHHSVHFPMAQRKQWAESIWDAVFAALNQR